MGSRDLLLASSIFCGTYTMLGRIALAACVLLISSRYVVANESPAASEITPEQRRHFETHVRPVLAANCLRCHGAKKQRGGLRLDSREGLLRGGESGAAFRDDEPLGSLLIAAIQHNGLQMPPDGKLSEAEIDGLVSWIRMGAPWPSDARRIETLVDRREKTFSEADRSYWAFQLIDRHGRPGESTRPEIGSIERTPVDRFITTKLDEHRLTAAPAATPATLMRRVSFDLTGLPPSRDELLDFETDLTPDAYERLLDRLLASPAYGEKWARHWLDLVRYADSDGYKQDDFRPHAWRYRDYTVQAFNRDKSYRDFIREQLAGDETDPGNPDSLVATGFLRHWIYEYNQRDVRGQWTTVLNDLTDVTGDVFLGMGMGCARCHDHKYDPILQRDYYRLQAFFAPFRPRDEMVGDTSAAIVDYAAAERDWQSKTAEIRQRMAEIEAPHRSKVTQSAIAKFPKDIRAILSKPEAERLPLEFQLAEFASRQIELEQVNLKMESKLAGEEKEEWLALSKRLGEYAVDRPPVPGMANVVHDVGPLAPPTTIPGRPGIDIAPGFLSILDPTDAVLPALPLDAKSTGRRTALANWLTRDDHPLVSRVIVNRVWQHHFGKGLVTTASDFGRLGEPPSHPELLDWLATRFQSRRWEFKPLHRLFMLTATYRQDSNSSDMEASLQIDPENRWLSHMPLRRLQAEQIRDAMLVASGELDHSAGGPGSDADKPRRSIYVKVIRNRRDPLIDAFDGVDNFTSTADRNVTTTPTQALLMINGPFAVTRAAKLAEQITRDESGMPRTPKQVVDSIFESILRRAPTVAEQSRFAEWIASAADRTGTIQDICHVLMNSNEFLYVK